MHYTVCIVWFKSFISFNIISIDIDEDIDADIDIDIDIEEGQTNERKVHPLCGSGGSNLAGVGDYSTDKTSQT